MKMQEKVRPFEILVPKFKLPKHGYTKIELVDKGGHKEVVEDENMITKALEYYFANGGLMNYINADVYNAADMVQELLGGIFLFDNEITESNEIVTLPAGLNMTANMAVGITNNANPPELGSYSSTESGYQVDGSFVQVYDFTTTQGNGDIACACLTSKVWGANGCGNGSGTRKSWGSSSGVGYLDRLSGDGIWGLYSFIPFEVDETNGIVWGVPAKNVAYGGLDYRNELFTNYGKIKVQKRAVALGKIDIKGNRLLEENEYTVSSSIISAFSGYSDGKVVCDNKKLYVLYINPSYAWSSDNPIKILTIDKTGITYNEVSNLTGETLYADYRYTLEVYDGYVYLPKMTTSSSSSYDYSTIYKIRISDGAVVDVSTGNYAAGEPWSSGYRIPIGRGLFQSYNGILNLKDNKVKAVNGYSAGNVTSMYGTPLTNNPLLQFKNEGSGLTSSYSKVYRNGCYIASINNLESPVTKTPDKTMKVTYRISF